MISKTLILLLSTALLLGCDQLQGKIGQQVKENREDNCNSKYLLSKADVELLCESASLKEKFDVKNLGVPEASMSEVMAIMGKASDAECLLKYLSHRKNC